MGENPQAQGGEKRVRSKVRSPRTLPAASLFCLLLTETPARLQTFACQEPPPEHLPNSYVALMAQLEMPCIPQKLLWFFHASLVSGSQWANPWEKGRIALSLPLIRSSQI